MNPIERMILDLAVEDSVGTWEFIWRARDTLPDIEESAVKDAVKEMLRQGNLEARRMLEEEVPLAVDDALKQLSMADQWNAPAAGAPHLRLVASEDGATTYYRLPTEGG